MVNRWKHFFTPTATHRRLGLACLGVGHQRDFAMASPRVLDCHGAVFVIDGTGRLEWGRPTTSSDLVAPVLFWLFPGVSHAYGPPAQGWEHIWVLFEGPAAHAYEDLGYLPRTNPVLPVHNPATIRRTLDRLLDTCREQRPGVEVTSAHLVHELILTAQRLHTDPNSAGDAAVLAELRKDARCPISVGEHAARLGLSLSSLRRTIRRAAGCTPKEYILRIRLNHAKALLAESDLTVAQIAREVGHDDPAYFSRIFTRRAGLPPSTFRAQQRHRSS